MSGIHLDTNALIALLEPSSKLIDHLRQQATNRLLPSVSAIVWHEFVRGPLLSNKHTLGVLGSAQSHGRNLADQAEPGTTSHEVTLSIGFAPASNMARFAG